MKQGLMASTEQFAQVLAPALLPLVGTCLPDSLCGLGFWLIVFLMQLRSSDLFKYIIQ